MRRIVIIVIRRIVIAIRGILFNIPNRGEAIVVVIAIRSVVREMLQRLAGFVTILIHNLRVSPI